MSGYEKGYVKISPSKARKAIKENPYILLVDVREPEEYYSAHIPGSINIPLQTLGWGIMNMSLSPYYPIICYCKTGIRAASAANMLTDMGFQNVYTMGGIKNWPYETIGYGGWNL